MLSLMFLVALPVLSQIINPCAKCEKRVMNYHGIYGKCWTGLVSVKTPLNAYDISGITSNCLIFLLSVLSVIAAYKFVTLPEPVDSKDNASIDAI